MGQIPQDVLENEKRLKRGPDIADMPPPGLQKGTASLAPELGKGRFFGEKREKSEPRYTVVRSKSIDRRGILRCADRRRAPRTHARQTLAVSSPQYPLPEERSNVLQTSLPVARPTV